MRAISSATAASASASVWLPSTPKVRSTTSKSPKRSNRSSTSAAWVSVASASKPTTSSVVAPAASSSCRAPSSASGWCAASTTVRPRRPTSRRRVASAMSDPPPNTSTDWTSPRASRTRGPFSLRTGSEETEPAGQVRLEHPGRVDTFPDAPEVVEARIHLRDPRRVEARVLGEVDAAAGVDHEPVEPGEEPGAPSRTGGDVERQRPAWARERQRTRVGRTEALQHREDRRALRAAELLERRPNGVGGVVVHDVLVLHEAAAPVEAVPAAHAVEWVEEGLDPFEVTDLELRRLVEPELVERADAEPVEQP